MTPKHRREQHSLNLDLSALALDGHECDALADANGIRAEAADSGAVTDAGAPGKIEVSPKAISHLASRSAQRCYGVVGLASRNARPGWAELLRGHEAAKGVDVAFSDGRVIIDLYVVIEYGTRISEVARNVMSSVKFALESALAVPVVQVNVNIQGIRVSGSGQV